LLEVVTKGPILAQKRARTKFKPYFMGPIYPTTKYGSNIMGPTTIKNIGANSAHTFVHVRAR